MLKTIGGDRLGSGNKMKTELHNYERSTHDLGNIFRTTMAPGVLVPFYKKLCQNGDTWKIDLSTLIKTIPAIGPLFGTYKFQLDMFEVPIRLYNGILHNNWTKIGNNMQQVKLPKIELTGKWINPTQTSIPNFNQYQVSASSLLTYMGIRGIGGAVPTQQYTKDVQVKREFNAVPILAYYDIFKNYYANKQEKNAYVIDAETEQGSVARIEYIREHGEIIGGANEELDATTAQTLASTWGWKFGTRVIYNGVEIEVPTNRLLFLRNRTYEVKLTGEIDIASWEPFLQVTNGQNVASFPIFNDTTNFITNYDVETNTIYFRYIGPAMNGYKLNWLGYTPNTSEETANLKITSFELENIDRMRMEILKDTGLNNQFYVNTYNSAPYNVISKVTTDGHCNSRYKNVGLVLKTYQSDLYNNWLSSEWIDGMNGINAISAVDTSTGNFTIDALNLAHKVYNMLNRIAISGGSYQDWQEAVYGEDVTRMAESPIYCGSLAGHIGFEEVVSTSETNTAESGNKPLGSLSGKGTITNIEGGHIDIHIGEPAYIIGIASITPLIDYCQGNDFDMTELDSLNDIHKPELDQIGFQDLMLEQAAWWCTEFNQANNTWVRHAGGKSPAWINYMTSVNQVYGDFCDQETLGFMCLTRRYEYGTKIFNDTNRVIPLDDYTTYINPTKFNYQFADTSLDSQNFWVQIKIDAEARRKMSAKIIPNL